MGKDRHTEFVVGSISILIVLVSAVGFYAIYSFNEAKNKCTTVCAPYRPSYYIQDGACVCNTRIILKKIED